MKNKIKTILTNYLITISSIFIILGTILTVVFSGYFSILNFITSLILIKSNIYPKTKYCYVTDENHHWYFIPVRNRIHFYDSYPEEIVKYYNKYKCIHPVNYMFDKKEVLKENVCLDRKI